MNTAKLKTFAQTARRRLMEQVRLSLEAALLMEGAAAAENRFAIAELKKALLNSSKEEVVERVAYTWFNRFCALRFMDVNNYSFVRVLSPAVNETQPEILAEAKRGIFREELAKVDQNRVVQFLTGQMSSGNPQGEAYRLLLVGACNYYSSIMPYLFEKINDYSELLLPLDLLSADSVLSEAVQTLDEESCQNVEVIGWLYQFYISEKKDAIFAAKQPVAAEDIPAATQLFTPNWIVRYLLENSLGRLWMLNHPNSQLKERMDYYIEPSETEEFFLKVKSPEELRICDPAVGSGHMLVYAFDLLYAIYEEEGYPPNEIVEHILRQNLYGIEIDERAGTLAAFALTMKARQKQRRFFRNPVQPNICVMESIEFTGEELNQYVQAVGKNLFSFKLDLALQQFVNAKHFGSLIRPEIGDVHSLRETIEAKNLSGDLFLFSTHQKVKQLLKQIEFLSMKYHVVIANPPYMGSGKMNAELKEFLKNEYKDFRSDLFAAFVSRINEMTAKGGFLGLMTPFTWMFISSFEKLREKIMAENTITSLIRPEYHAFFDSAYVPLCAFTMYSYVLPDYRGAYIDLNDFYGSEIQSVKALEAIKDPQCAWLYHASVADFKKIPSSPIAYWVSDKFLEIFDGVTLRQKSVNPATGLQTGSNSEFIRYWYEVSQSQKEIVWFPLNDGGDSRKWYGNFISYLNWFHDGEKIKGHKSSVIRNNQYYFREGGTWNRISASFFAVRYLPSGFIFDQAGDSFFAENHENTLFMIGFLNTKISFGINRILAPTLNTTAGNLELFPYPSKAEQYETTIVSIVEECIKMAQFDWDCYETSWNFSHHPILREEFFTEYLAESYNRLRQHWREMTLEMQQLEEENNRIFIEAYGLQDELSPDVPLEEITLTCNPPYRYGGKKSEEALEAQLLSDTIKEFISYAVGCMFGRYSIDKDSLILANQGETLKDYLRQIPAPRYPADADNIIPILEEPWFNDDIVEKFKSFLSCTFGEENYRENLAFVEKALGRDLRSYFLRDFYDEHIRRYNKRPIYWLFSSPKGSFNVLIYMHRYAPDTLSLILNNYLREYRKKLDEQIRILEMQSISASSSKADKTAALKGIEKYKKILKELDGYERDILYPLAAKQLEIDLDDGVKVNYQKFGAALKPIAGLDSGE